MIRLSVCCLVLAIPVAAAAADAPGSPAAGPSQVSAQSRDLAKSVPQGTRQHQRSAAASDEAGAGTIAELLEPPVFLTQMALAQTDFGTWVKTINTSTYGPPSPDPAGIVYFAATDRFLISDSEVDEMSIYQGSNLYTGTRTGSGTGTGTGTTILFTQEPSGLGYDPATGTLFISDDDRDKIFLDRPGPDGRYGSADDIVSSFSTTAFGSTDAEDVVYDVASGHLFISDGTGLEVYDVNPVNGVFGDGNDVVTHFDVGVYGPRDAEGIGIDPQSDHLLVVDPSTKSVYELTKSGALVRIIDCRSFPGTDRAYADIVMAPTSDPNDPPSKLDYWMVDRGFDNGGDPNENDGRLYEFTAPSTAGAPSVTVTAPVEGARVTGTTTVQATTSGGAGITQVAFSVDGTPIGTDTNGADGWSISWNTTSGTDGSHTVRATATDTNGQTGTDTNTVTVDNTAPSVTLTAPAEGATVSGTISVQATASDASGITSVAFSVDGAAIGTDTNGADGWSVSWDTTTVVDGPHSVNARATDGVGKTANDSNSVTVQNSSGGVEVEVTAPAEGAAVSGNVLVQASTTGDVTQVAFTVDGTALGTDTNGANGWSIGWDTTAHGDGSHTVTATATDALQNTATDSNGVSVDNTAPTVTLTSPADGALVSGTVVLSATASDSGGMAGVSFAVDGNVVGTDTNGADGWSISWNSGSVADGLHALTATATDRAGNTGTDSNALSVDNTAPLVTLTAPAQGAIVSQVISLQAAASDLNGVARVTFKVDGVTVGIDSNGADGWSTSWDSTTVADGAHSIAATATDTAGGSATDSNGVTVDNTAPVVSITSPADGAAVRGTVNVQATASDAGGVTQVAFAVDGTSLGTDTNGADGWSISWNTTTVPDGAHTVTATATDVVGRTASDSNSATVDNTAPTISITSPTTGAVVVATIPVEAQAADARGVASVQFFVDGASIGTDTNGADGWSVSWDSTTGSNGSHALTARASDAVGNATTSAPVAVTVDNPDVILDVPVSNKFDDALEYQDGKVDRNQHDLELGEDIPRNMWDIVGLRFAGLNVPRNATIVNAYIQFTTDERGTVTTNLTVRGQSSDTAATFTSTNFNISSRPQTTASVAWAPPAWTVVNEAGPGQRTPNLSSVVQEVVNRAGWSPGNALAMFVRGTGRRTAMSFDGGQPPTLHIQYERP